MWPLEGPLTTDPMQCPLKHGSRVFGAVGAALTDRIGSGSAELEALCSAPGVGSADPIPSGKWPL